MRGRLLLIPILLALAVPATGRAESQYYVSVGDSYAAGFQPARAGGSRTEGFADQVVGLAAERGYDLKLRNFGCGGASTRTVLERKGCPARGRPAANAVVYGSTPAGAATRFLKRHRARTALVSVSLGFNDVYGCLSRPGGVACVREVMPRVEANLERLLKRFRRAAGPNVRIVGTSYPDVVLAAWLRRTKAGRRLARRSQVAFRTIFNPALRKRYAAADGTFVDVTAATGGYDPLGDARPPAPVARVCDLTWFCTIDDDVHPNSAGYKVIAELITATLPDRG